MSLPTSYQSNDEHRSLLEGQETSKDSLFQDDETRTTETRSYQHNKNNYYTMNASLIRVIMVAVTTILVAIGGLFWYFQREIHTLEDEITNENEIIQQLQGMLNQHESVIERFNTSVSNQDVIMDVQALRTQLVNVTDAITKQLQSTQQSIQTELQITQQQLQQTVADAENEIHNQVIQVKQDVDQYVITTQDQFSMENSFMVYQLAGTFTVLSCLISMWHMTSHIRRFYQPNVQRKILAILWMSPIYAITSWFSLVFPSSAGWLAIIKDGYEGYVIYTFLSFCIAVIGNGDRTTVVNVLADHADVSHLPPPYKLSSLLCCCCAKNEPYESTRALADAVLLQCQQFAIQFVFLRPLTTAAIVILKKYNYLHGPADTLWDYRSPQLYIIIIQNVSIFLAFSGLLKFYHAVDIELAWCRPFAKFLCIKGVVFMTFWQGLAISVLAQTTDGDFTNMNKPSMSNKQQEWAESSQNFLICLEMLLFSIAHFYCFPVEEWEEGYRESYTDGTKSSRKKTNFGDTVALGDFVADLKLLLSKRTHTNSGSTGLGKKLKRKQLSSRSTHTTDTILEQDDETEDIDRLSPLSSIADEEKGVNNNNNIDNCVSNGNEDEDEDENNYGSQQQSFVAGKLQESLGSLLDDDPEIAQAAKHLIASNVLSDDFFDYSETNDDDIEEQQQLQPSNTRTDDSLCLKGNPRTQQSKSNEKVGTEPSNKGHKAYSLLNEDTNTGDNGTLQTLKQSDYSIFTGFGKIPPPPTDPPPVAPSVTDEDVLNTYTSQLDEGIHQDGNRQADVEVGGTFDYGTTFDEILKPSLLSTDATRAELGKRNI